MKKPSEKKALKNLIRILLLVICGGMLGFNIYSANAGSLVGNKFPMPFGVGAAVVLSGSMEPELSKGDLIIAKEADSYKKDEVVVFQDGNSLTVHRIIEIDGEKIVTKGDANNTPDEAIQLSDVKGKVVFSIPYVGPVINFLKSPIGTILVLVAAIALLEIPRYREKKLDDDQLEKIKEEIRRLKDETEQ